MPQQNRERIERRRELVYELYLMSYTQRQISDALTARGYPVAQQTIADDLKILRQRNAKWFDQDSDLEMRSMFKEIVDKIRKVENEGWTLYYNTPSENFALRSQILMGILKAIVAEAKALQLTWPTLTELWILDQIRKAEDQHEQIRQLINANRLP